MLAGVEKIYDNYLRVLVLLKNYSELAIRDREEHGKALHPGTTKTSWCCATS